ncbi:MAG TPA: ATP12 family protein [Roseiarcus sp.]|nr:ATP12 family protein [Roseiarcus sp.]
MSDAPPANPMRAAQANMRPVLPKRFYKAAGVVERDGGFALVLDGRGARTPAKNPLVLSTLALAELIAAEWAGQGETIDPSIMPATRLANSAIDGVAQKKAEVRAEVAAYAGADLLCYRAGEPEALVAAEAAAFDPVLDWAHQAFGARLILSEGITHVAQSEASLQAIGAALEAVDDPFALAALHVMTTLTGSALLALAVAKGAVSTEEAWRAAHVDEDFQTSQWGEDMEAASRRAARWREMEAAARVFAAAGGRWGAPPSGCSE